MSAAASALDPPRVCSGLGMRWLKFNFVGAIGIGVQLVALWILVHRFRCNYLVATVLAVETAVLHNFFWHQRFTWAERRHGLAGETAQRLLQFNLANGGVSIVGNVILMRLLAGSLHLPILVANITSIAICSVANFVLSEVYVFRDRVGRARLSAGVGPAQGRTSCSFAGGTPALHGQGSGVQLPRRNQGIIAEQETEHDVEHDIDGPYHDVGHQHFSWFSEHVPE